MTWWGGIDRLWSDRFEKVQWRRWSQAISDADIYQWTKEEWTRWMAARAMWLKGWMDEWKNESINEVKMTAWINEWTNEWMKEWMNEWRKEWRKEGMNEGRNEWRNEWMNEWKGWSLTACRRCLRADPSPMPQRFVCPVNHCTSRSDKQLLMNCWWLLCCLLWFLPWQLTEWNWLEQCSGQRSRKMWWEPRSARRGM